MKQPRSWFGTITRPWTHLVATIAVFLIIAVATVVSVNNPEWSVALFILALVPGLGWYAWMMSAYYRSRHGGPTSAP
ncbi:hypothetical protein ACFQ0P_02405 [Microbacterium insulae]|uniref:Cardiolipin synthase N-terminal domain-containing protein n=1 Tax=Microbacterium insulae TaxID=483014 RepID=A0ABW3AEF7_9MICO